MDLQLIDKELCESRVYRYSKNFNKFDGRDVANLLYITTLLTYMFTLDDETQDYGTTYARQTSQYGSYGTFRTHATDLYMLAYQISNPDNSHVKLSNSTESKKFINSLFFFPRAHLAFMSHLAHGKMTTAEAYSYLYRLENQLKIADAKYKRWRRLVLDWVDLKDIQKQLVIAQTIQEIRKYSVGSEMVIPLTSMLKDRSYQNSELAYSGAKEPSLTTKLAGAALGAYAANKIAPKVAQYAQTNPETFKQAATGLGAIAGYWAAGRKAVR